MLVGEGYDHLMGMDDEMLRASNNCAHMVGKTFIQGNYEMMVIGGNGLTCVLCPEQNSRISETKYKGLITPSLLKGYVENGILSDLQAQRIVLTLLKRFGREALIDIDNNLLNGGKKCPSNM